MKSGETSGDFREGESYKIIEGGLWEIDAGRTKSGRRGATASFLISSPDDKRNGMLRQMRPGVLLEVMVL